MPLQQAIYSSAQTCIYAVRGGWVFKYNATTGAKESEFRFSDDVYFSESSIVEIGGVLYIAVWRAAVEVTGAVNAGADIFAVNYALTLSTALGLPGSGPFTNQPGTFGNYGFTGIVSDGTKIYGYYGPRAANLFSVNPTSIGGAVVDSFGTGEGFNFNSIEIDTVNSVLWTTGGDTQQVWCKEKDLTGFEQAGSSDPVDTALGLCIVPGATPKVYYVTGGQDIIKPDVAAAYAALPSLSSFGVTVLSILEGDAKPIRIRYNSVDGLVYIPTGVHNTVEVMNPATDTITAIKTGFSCPIDVVFTPSKKFAVQDGSLGLKEIT